MMPELMRIALVAISRNRSKDSWVAGSSVLSQFIQRAPNDIDIHHVNLAAFNQAVDKDTRALADAGFSIATSRPADAELEIVFLRSNGTLAINWVLEQEQPTALINDPLFGTRASFADVIARKVEMHLENHHSKHRDDLLALLEHSASISAEMSLDQLVGSISALDLAKYVNTNLRGSTR
ncbi:MAG: hypothetical protein EOR01_02680 [Mesorhizobium sp.]|uniref:hypothetical protein n=1 Tax=Mesorhizobium sp. TaxID=1871066 RepID=UPI000FE605D6|nr:hypothetical protein [Mesorhizobium sp.]RWP25750.1 MAG: hypothetical protein EOR01_02680 [Mesorhizobium sp.]